MTQNKKFIISSIICMVISPFAIFLGGVILGLITPKTYCMGRVRTVDIIPGIVKKIYEISHANSIPILRSCNVYDHFGIFCMVLIVCSGIIGTLGLRLLPINVTPAKWKKAVVGLLCLIESVIYSSLYSIVWKLDFSWGEFWLRLILALLVFSGFHLGLLFYADHISLLFIISISVVMFVLLSYVFAFYLYRIFVFVLLFSFIGEFMEIWANSNIFIFYRD